MRLASLLALAALLPGCRQGNAQQELVVFAAASLRDVAVELADAYRAEAGVELVFNFAGSNVLARQIEAAPKADVFLSASERWADDVVDAGRCVPDSKRVFASNQLVVVTRADSKIPLDGPCDLAAPAVRHVAIGDPAGVPAGRYARQFLEKVICASGTLWSLVEDRIVPQPDVRAALALVESDPVVAGIVYRTDAASSQKVTVRFSVPEELSPEIRYCAVAIARDGAERDEARRFLDFLVGPAGQAIFEKQGFVPRR